MFSLLVVTKRRNESSFAFTIEWEQRNVPYVYKLLSLIAAQIFRHDAATHENGVRILFR